ncbi:MAG: tetratricopeptide repeat protein [Candidatus Sulfopaludibacter sp.]|nr:tetratricopeptide repeat protein [Candidatus Sulfopaludibacter sp.]
MIRLCAVLCIAGTLAPAADNAQSALEAAQAALAGGDYARAVEQAEQAASAFHSRHDLSGEKLAADAAGSAYLYRGDYDLALERYRTALQIDRQQHDTGGEITRLANIGSVYFYRGRYSEALAEYQQALRRGGGQLVFTNLATLYQQLGENQKALDYYQQALALGPSADLLSNAGTLYRRLGEPAKALESYRTARALYAKEHRNSSEVRTLEAIGVTQAMDLHDLNAAVASFSDAVKLAPPHDEALAHLFRGEALYRMHRPDAAADDFRAAGDTWLALYRLGDLTKALAVRDTPLRPGFFPARRNLYDDAISRILHAGNPDPQRLFELFERAHDSPADPPPLQAVQARLAPGSMLVEYWSGDGQNTALWATKERAGIGTDFPLAGISQLLIVPDGAPETSMARYATSYLPYASFLLRDEPWRSPLMPWRTRRLAVTTKYDLYNNSDAPIVAFHSPATSDPEDPDRSHIVLSPTDSLYRGEIQSLPLARTDLVVLPTADTAQVFSRAFLAAGARSSLTTLWPVPVAQTAGFLRRFYAELSSGKNKAEALRAARRASGPAGAAFILTGDGQLPTRPVLSWWWVVAAGFLASSVIFATLRR